MAEQLCWRCNRVGTGTCAWDRSKGVIPVEGWTAKEVPWRDYTGVYSTSYQITACPLFDEQEDYYERAKTQSGSKTKSCKIRGEQLKKMEFRFQCNWTLRAIADEFGIARRTVSTYKEKWIKKQKGMIGDEN